MYALLLMHFEKALQSTLEAQENFVAFLQQLLDDAVPIDSKFCSAILRKEEIPLFNILSMHDLYIVIRNE